MVGRPLPRGGVGEDAVRGDPVVDALVLRAVTGLGDRGFRVLVDAFGSAGAVLAAPEGDLVGRAGVSEGLAAAIRALGRAERERAGQEVSRARARGIRPVPYGDPAYPASLAEIHDPPAVLYVAGSLLPEDVRAVAVVGSRGASVHGVRFARRLARGLAVSGVTVVSGLARGIDAAAHRGALEAGGRTIAAFGAGLDVVYPRGNRELADAVRRSGAWVGELSLGSPPLGHHFPRRNRIISGLSLGVVVVEASRRSGSLITAACALEQGREVFAVPGLPGSPTASGVHGLLKQGARLVESVDDVLAELPPGPESPRPRPAAGPARDDPLRPLWEALSDAPAHIDEVAVRAGLAAADAAAGLMELTLAGYAEEWPGNCYSRAGPG